MKTPPSETKILTSWNTNAKEWQKLISNNQIESRKLATNAAIISAIERNSWKKVLDVGCGEGWLVRAMLKKGIEAFGVDGSDALIKIAQQKAPDRYQCISYEEIIEGQRITNATFDGIVLNFALFDKNRPPLLLKKLSSYLNSDGKIIIQSISPREIQDPKPWKEDVWNGLSGTFHTSYAWYHPNEAEWMSIFSMAGLRLINRLDIKHPDTHIVLSVIFELGVVAN